MNPGYPPDKSDNRSRFADGRSGDCQNWPPSLSPVNVAVIGGGIDAARAAEQLHKHSSCFRDRADPVTSGLVSSINRPGGNVTGVSFMTFSYRQTSGATS